MNIIVLSTTIAHYACFSTIGGIYNATYRWRLKDLYSQLGTRFDTLTIACSII